MFGLFKKTSWKIRGKTREFFQEIFSQLPIEFQFLSEGLNKDLYKIYSINPSLKNRYSIGFDSLQSDNAMVKGKQFELTGIIVIQDGEEFAITLSIHEGLWIGFECRKNIAELKNYQIDLSQLKKAKSKFAPDSKIEKLVRGLSSDKLELDNLSEFYINEICYYQIKDLGDGNYIAIDSKGQVFGLIHHLNRVELINKSITAFVEDVNSGIFNFEQYIDRQ